MKDCVLWSDRSSAPSAPPPAQSPASDDLFGAACMCINHPNLLGLLTRSQSVTHSSRRFRTHDDFSTRGILASHTPIRPHESPCRTRRR